MLSGNPLEAIRNFHAKYSSKMKKLLVDTHTEKKDNVLKFKETNLDVWSNMILQSRKNENKYELF